jgi:hypothetical protein
VLSLPCLAGSLHISRPNYPALLVLYWNTATHNHHYHYH